MLINNIMLGVEWLKDKRHKLYRKLTYQRLLNAQHELVQIVHEDLTNRGIRHDLHVHECSNPDHQDQPYLQVLVPDDKFKVFITFHTTWYGYPIEMSVIQTTTSIESYNPFTDHVSQTTLIHVKQLLPALEMLLDAVQTDWMLHGTDLTGE